MRIYLASNKIIFRGSKLEGRWNKM